MPNPAPKTRSGLVVVALCFLTIVADGFDLIIYGATVPSLVKEWGLAPTTIANIGSLTLVGLMIGFLVAGRLADRFGRRTVLLVGGTWFSLACAVCAFAPNVEFFATARFLAGLGLGGVVPSAVALTAEYAPAGRRMLYNGLMLCGYPIGGVLATFVALAVLPTSEAIAAAAVPDQSWRIMYGLGAAYIVIIPVMLFLLPESASYLALSGKIEKAERLARTYQLDWQAILAEKKAKDSGSAKTGFSELFSPRYRVSMILFILIMFCIQVLVYGPNTWLPKMAADMGFAGMQGTWALMMLQVGAVVGTILGAVLIDRGGTRTVVIPYFLLGAVALLVMAFAQTIGGGGLFAGAFFAGMGTVATSTLMYGVLAVHFPTSSRSSAVGLALGIGRFGAILGPQVGAIFASPRAGLIAFTVPAVIGAILVLLLPRAPREELVETEVVTAS